MHRIMTGLAQAMAILGGVVLGLLVLMTCVSVLGRGLNTFFHGDLMEAHAPGLAAWAIDLGIGPVLGDFELIENFMPFAIFAFLPLAQMHSSHATVDVFTTRFPPVVLQWMRAVTEVVFAAVLILFAFKLFEGMQGKIRNGETTYLLQFPVWWAFSVAFAASLVAAVVSVYMAGVRVVEAALGIRISEDPMEVDH